MLTQSLVYDGEMIAGHANYVSSCIRSTLAVYIIGIYSKTNQLEAYIIRSAAIYSVYYNSFGLVRHLSDQGWTLLKVDEHITQGFRVGSTGFWHYMYICLQRQDYTYSYMYTIGYVVEWL